MPLLEPGAASAVPLPPPVPALSKYVYHITVSLPLQPQQCYRPEIAPSKVLSSAIFPPDMKSLKGWILKIDNYFPMIETGNKQQQLTYIGLCTEDKVLEW